MPIDEGFAQFTAQGFDGGLVTRFPAHRLGANQSPDAQNFDPTEVGCVKKRKGYIKFTGSTQSGNFCSGLFGATTSAGTTKILASVGTALYDITSGTWSAISGPTITSDTMVSMTMFNDLFIICNTGGGPYKWTGSGATASLGGSPPPNGKYTAVHKGRLWIAGPGYDYSGAASDASRVNGSGLNNPELWDTTTNPDNCVSIGFNKGDGYVVNGICSAGDFMLVSKISNVAGSLEGAIYSIFGSSPFDFVTKKILSYPALSNTAMLAYDNFVVVATPKGIFGINGRNPVRMDDPVWPTYDAIPNKGTIALGRYKKTIRIAYPASGTTNNRELILDVERGVWGLNTGKAVRVYANHPDGRLLLGKAGSSVLVWEDENGTNDDGSAIDFYWETPDIDFADGNAQKRMHSIFVHAKNTGSLSLSLEQYGDGTARSLGGTMNVSTEGPVKRFEADSTPANYHRIRATNNASGQDVTLYRIEAYAEPLQTQSSQ